MRLISTKDQIYNDLYQALTEVIIKPLEQRNNLSDKGQKSILDSPLQKILTSRDGNLPTKSKANQQLN